MPTKATKTKKTAAKPAPARPKQAAEDIRRLISDAVSESVNFGVELKAFGEGK